MARVFIVILLGALVAIGVGTGLVRWQQGPPEDTAAGSTAAPQPEAQSTQRIRVNLFYIDADGLDLVPVEREVPYAKGIADQARLILEEQLKPPAEPLGPVVPEGVTVRAFYLTESGSGFADFSGELASAHVGGSLDEMLTVYALVNAVTINVPLVKTMQILVNGREVDTLAGHIDLRHPLTKNTSLVKGSRNAAATGATPGDGAASSSASPATAMAEDGAETPVVPVAETPAPASPGAPSSQGRP